MLAGICFIFTSCGTTSQNQENTNSVTEATTEKLELSNVVVGKWITTSGTASDTARIYQFYESGILDSYIGNDSEKVFTGCYKVDGEKIYMNFFSRSNPEDGGEPLTVISFDKNEIVVKAKDKIITWKRYQ